MILELRPDLVPITNIINVADEAVKTFHVKVVDTINMTDYKAIVILAEPDNPITKDPRFVQYGEDYKAQSNYTGGGELRFKFRTYCSDTSHNQRRDHT